MDIQQMRKGIAFMVINHGCSSYTVILLMYCSTSKPGAPELCSETDPRVDTTVSVRSLNLGGEAGRSLYVVPISKSTSGAIDQLTCELEARFR